MKDKFVLYYPRVVKIKAVVKLGKMGKEQCIEE